MAKLVKYPVSWQPSPSPDVTGYKVYYAQGDTVDYNSPFVQVAADVNSITIPDDIPDFPLEEATFAIGITAVDDVGNESNFIQGTAPFDFAAPDAPTDLVIG